ncbi:aminotransferase class V-fold PLP-dependent enzyme [Escherichia coli]
MVLRVVHFPADVQQLDIDLLCFLWSQTVWPRGIGVLYGKSELLEAMSPWLGGGKIIHEVSFDGFTTQSAPWKMEAGTPNVAGVIGSALALEWLADYDINQAESWSRSLATLAEEALRNVQVFRSFRCQDSSLLAFDFAGVHHSDMVTLLAEYGIALRAGQHCAQPLLAELGVTGTLRASFAPYNTKSDVDALVNAVDRALELLVD